MEMRCNGDLPDMGRKAQRKEGENIRGEPVQHHATYSQSHAHELLGGDTIAQEQPAAQQHTYRLAVPQHL